MFSNLNLKQVFADFAKFMSRRMEIQRTGKHLMDWDHDHVIYTPAEWTRRVDAYGDLTFSLRSQFAKN